MRTCSSTLTYVHSFIDQGNEANYLQISSIVPSIITCLIGKRLGSETSPSISSYPLRDYAASLIGLVCRRFGDSSHTLKPRLARTLLKNFLDNTKPYGTLYGAIVGLASMGNHEVVRVLILPNVKTFEDFIRDEIMNDGPRKVEAEMCLKAIIMALERLKEDEVELMMDAGRVEGTG